MIDLSENAKRSLDEYLQQVRTYLRWSRTLDASEVEQSITEHIESELGDSPGPVSYDRLDAVLQRLGSPRQWVPEEELPWWRKMILRVRTGPEDWRLAYLSFGLLLAGFLFFIRSELFFAMAAASFVVSRAALSAADSHKELGARKWLIYPSLILAYLFISFLLLFGVAFPAAYMAEELWCIDQVRDFARMGELLFVVSVTVIAGAFWWIILGIASCRWPALVRNIFKPFADKFSPKWAVALMCTGLGVLLLSLAVLTSLRVFVFGPFE